MSALELALMVFLSGLTVAGLVGSLVELASGRELSFELLKRMRSLWSMALLAATTGPLMLANDALLAARHGSLSLPLLGAALGASLLWTAALGVVIIRIAAWTVALLAIELPR